MKRQPARITGARDRILSTARRLFAEQGIGNVSLRDVIRAAGVNPAAVHYHFGSRLALLREVFREARTPLNAERRELLGRAAPPAALQDVLHAFFWPIFRRLDRPRDAQAASDLAFISQLRLDPSPQTRAVLTEHERELDELFESALFRSLPGIEHATIRVRMHLANSTAWDVAGQCNALEWITSGAADRVPALYQAFLDFVVAGFRQKSAVAAMAAAGRGPAAARQRTARRPARSRRITI